MGASPEDRARRDGAGGARPKTNQQMGVSSMTANRSGRRWALALALGALAATAPLGGGAQAEGITLKYATTAPPGSHIAKFFERHVAAFNKVAPAVIQYKIYHLTLGNMKTIYDNTKNGVADIGWISPTMIPGKFRKTEFTRLPGMCDIAEYCSVAIWHAYRKGMYGNEYDEVPPIAVHAYPPSIINLTASVKSIDNLEGRKIAALGKEAADFVEGLNGTPLSIGLFSFYQSLQTHVVSGALITYTAFDPFKLPEVVNWHYEVNSGGSNAYMGISKKKWDSLPAAAKKVIESQEGEKFSRALGHFWDGVWANTRGRVSKMPGHHIVQATPAQKANIQKVVDRIVAKWIAEVPGAEKLIAFVKNDYDAQVRAAKTQ
jgi:TRAP-type transport system periplasmic protein